MALRRESIESALMRLSRGADAVTSRIPRLELPFAERIVQPRDEPVIVVPNICPSCSISPDLEQFAALGVCPECGYHLRISARARLAHLVDPHSFVEEDADLVGGDPLQFADSRAYPELHAAAQERTGLTEAVVSGRARIDGRPAGIAVFDFGFLGGTMGVAVGERLVRLFERSTDRRQPVIVVTGSGGARLQEGTVALSQMARVAAAVERHHAAGLLYISVLADPTTGGVMVSPASMGDIVLAEPGAFAAFAGRRVSGETELMGVEWLQSHGIVDGVVQRADLRERISLLVRLITHRNRPLRRMTKRTMYGELSNGESRAGVNPEAWETVQRARRDDRPSSRHYIAAMTQSFVELHGDRLYGDDTTVVGGLATFAGQSVVVLGQDRHSPEDGSRPTGRPYPEGFRKVLRLAMLAAKFDLPIITLIDTPGPMADAESEGRGLPFAIGRCLRVFSALPVPVVAAIVGEGGSGAAIALAVADRVLMLEHAIYEVISPEGAASILYRDRTRAPEMSGRMKLTAQEAKLLGVIDDVVPEPVGGAHTDPTTAFALLAESLTEALAQSERWLPGRLVNERYRRIQSIGAQYLKRRKAEDPPETRVEPLPELRPSY